jgi:predicted O-methyltransferase YrrM
VDLEKANDYISEIYKETDLPAAEDYMAKSGLEGPIIEDEIARLFKVLLKLMRPKRILEIGMNIGFSTASMALAVKEFGGRVTTIESDPDVVKFAKRSFERESVADSIEIIIGDAFEVLPEIESGSYDVVFQDSTKRGMRVLGASNESNKGIDEFNRALLQHDLESTILPIGEGCTIAVKLS